MEILAVAGLRLGGLCTLTDSAGNIFFHPGVHPGYLRALPSLPENYRSHILGSLELAEPEIIQIDCPIALTLHHHFVYGHFLLENVARIYLVHLLDQLGIQFKIAMPNQVPWFVRNAFEALYDSDRIISYDATRQVIVAPHVILPTMMQNNYSFHPLANLAMKFWKESMLSGTTPLTLHEAERFRHVYLSRAKLPYASWRSMANENEVETTLRDLGFTVVHPETLPLPEQMRIYANMNACVSEFGSASHNTLFSAPNTKSMVINSISFIQSRISQLRGQDLAIELAADGKVHRNQEAKASFVVDCAALREHCIAFFDL